MSKEIEKLLQAPFHESDVQWRVQQAGAGKNNNSVYVMAIPYINNRAIQKRLDEVFGVFGWENTHKPTPDGKGYLCGITVHHNGKSVTKWDGAEHTQIEPLKGALSDAMKRAAVQFGIGRYLYDLDVVFAKSYIVESRRDAPNVHVHFPEKGNRSLKIFIGWETPSLPEWAKPFKTYQHFIDAIKSAVDLEQLKIAFDDAYKAGQTSQNEELIELSIEEKDIREKAINAEIESIHALQFQEIKNWLANQVKTFKEFPTEITLSSYKNNVLENLKNKIKGKDFDCSAMVPWLEERYQIYLSKLQEKGKQNENGNSNT